MASTFNSTTNAKKVARRSTGLLRDEEERKKEIHTFKYSQNLRGPLHEGVIVGGSPAFLTYDSAEQRIRTLTAIEEPTRVIVPMEGESYPYLPYEFTNEKEIDAILRQARSETTETLYERARLLVGTFNDQDSYKTVLLAADIVWSYNQDRFATTHYLHIVGDNGSGKSTIGETFAALGYRAVNITDPTAPNYFRVLGTLEPGQCIIVADEADSIDRSPDLMGVLKAGYDISGRVSRINPFSNCPEYFFAYGLKAIIAERSLDQWRAKGVMDRTFSIHCYRGQSEYDIKEILVPAGNMRRQRLLDELLQLRKLLLMHRLIHFGDPIVDLDVGVQGRDKELVKPLLQLFHGTRSRTDIIVALQKFLDEKSERKQSLLESALYPIIQSLTDAKGSEISVALLWEEILSGIPGTIDEHKPYQYETREFGTLYYNTITRIVVDKFGAKSKRKSSGTVLLFNKEKLERFARAYTTRDCDAGRIKVSVIIEDDAVPGAGNVGSEGSKETDDASDMKSRENGATEPVYNSGQEELNKDNGAIPCAFYEHSFPDEEEALNHMKEVHPDGML
jgi:hypothetical protein